VSKFKKSKGTQRIKIKIQIKIIIKNHGNLVWFDSEVGTLKIVRKKKRIPQHKKSLEPVLTKTQQLFSFPEEQ
jgi:hypothetical protein